MSSKSSVYNHLPIHLRGEIIQIGAVRLSDGWVPEAEFQIDVKPVYFRKMHSQVKKLTGIDSEQLSRAAGFKEAFARFRAFCGEDCTFLTWGYDDKGILEQNIIVHDLDWDWISGWVNLQLIYNIQTDGERNQRSLQTAMEHFGIVQTRVAHNALGDAYNTALVCAFLDMEEGLADYENISRKLSLMARGREGAPEDEFTPPLEHLSFGGFTGRNDAFDDPVLTEIPCPLCRRPFALRRWVNQGDRRYMSLGSCEEHGMFLIRVRLRPTDEETWNVNRIVYRADEGMEEYYHRKSTQRRKRSRRRKR